MTHICVSKLIIIGSDNGLSPGRRQAIIWTNAGILLIGPLGTNFNEILIEIHIISPKKIHLKMSSEKWRPSCLGLNVLMQCSKLMPVRQPEADNIGGGLGTFLKLFFNFMFMVWDSTQQDWQLCWLSFEHWLMCLWVKAMLVNSHSASW